MSLSFYFMICKRGNSYIMGLIKELKNVFKTSGTVLNK